ncbi:hypothetical protein G6F43_014435 [Rhizopus delemar]|nr:hypothetical protein G6F43_014435 [Rhizopus delemar]
MWDRETGHVHFTGIWKALNNSKADIVKIVDSNPELQVKKVRGGCLDPIQPRLLSLRSYSVEYKNGAPAHLWSFLP